MAKSTTEIAKEVLDGKWGNGDERKKKLIKAGYNYDEVQKKVNELVIDKIAKEVIAGKWGNGDDRKKKLTKAGYNYTKVQKRVNEILTAKEKSSSTSNKTTDFQKKILAACKEQASWMKNFTYKWESNPTIEKSKKKGTCVTYVACVLQRLGYLKSGQYIWHDGKGYGTGKVYGTNDKMTTTYMQNKTFAQLKSKLQPGDIILCDDNKSGESGSGGHIMIFEGKWADNGNPYIWDQSCGKNGEKHRAYDKTHKILAIVRLKESISTTTKPSTSTTTTPPAASSTSKMPTGIFNDFIDTVKIGQATSNEKGSLGGGKAGDQTGGEVSISNYSYSSSMSSPYHWMYVLRAKDPKKRLIIADTCIKACKNNHIGYDTNSGDRKTFYNEAKKVKWKVDKITTNCETTCSELANVCCAAAGLKNVGASKQANVDTLRSTLLSTGEFTNIKLNKNTLQPGDILISDCHTAVVIQSLLNPDEVSQRAFDLQEWLNWYYDGKVGTADGVYGPNTKKWCSKFQDEKFGKGEGDGSVGQKTLKAMKAVKK